MRQRELFDQAFERPRLFGRGQLLALNVLDERDRDGLAVGELPNNDGNIGEARELCGLPAALAGNNFIFGAAASSREAAGAPRSAESHHLP